MTMEPWMARTLRRLAGNTAILLAAQALYFTALHARPDLPPSVIDLVQVRSFTATHAITDRASVDRIVSIVRSKGEWTRYPGSICLPGTPRIDFYQNTERRGTLVWGPRVIGVQGDHAFSTRALAPAQAAELHRLLNAP